MDNLDAGIIKELTGPDGSYQWNVRHPLSRIATKLGVDEETIRRRIRRLEQTGLMKGSELIINPYVMGREPIRMMLQVAQSGRQKQNAVSQVKLIDGVLLIIDMQGPAMQVLLFCESEEAISRRTKLISSICQCNDPIVLRNLEGLGFIRSNMKLLRTDLLILKSLRKNPRKGINQVAREIGVSPRTVERRVGIMIESKVFFHMFRLDFSKSDGVTTSMIVSYENGRAKQKIDGIINEHLNRVIFSATAASGASQFNFVSNNVAESEKAVEWIQGLKGVSNASMGIVKDYILCSEWLDNEIDGMLNEI